MQNPYEMESRSGVGSFVAFVLVFGGCLAFLVWSVLRIATGSTAATEALTADGGGMPASTTVAPVSGEDTEAVVAFGQEGLEAIEAETGAEYATAYFMIRPDTQTVDLGIEDPDIPGEQKVLDYTWRNGQVEGPDRASVPLVEFVNLNELDWEALPGLIDQARVLYDSASPDTLVNPRGLTWVEVESGLPFTEGTVIRVRFDGGEAHSGGWVEYAIDGTLLGVQPAQ
ncbi:MAG: hypothetical protein JJLCMIEE_02839 [Acidimicrobiales bacterium]|nr:MAG: hypothetical protein EDR02_13625 [Actinomycetota bacterium]MBV6509741.1 hypothetical protein [Acidimicrobiales bacterium]RIK04865.1 MAG: hypothetical protein DCC48_12565 [Acidobacteriota bacterium]